MTKTTDDLPSKIEQAKMVPDKVSALAGLLIAAVHHAKEATPLSRAEGQRELDKGKEVAPEAALKKPGSSAG